MAFSFQHVVVIFSHFHPESDLVGSYVFETHVHNRRRFTRYLCFVKNKTPSGWLFGAEVICQVMKLKIICGKIA